MLAKLGMHYHHEMQEININDFSAYAPQSGLTENEMIGLVGCASFKIQKEY